MTTAVNVVEEIAIEAPGVPIKMSQKLLTFHGRDAEEQALEHLQEQMDSYKELGFEFCSTFLGLYGSKGPYSVLYVTYADDPIEAEDIPCPW